MPVSLALLPACSGDDVTAETGDETTTGDGDGDPTGDGDGDPTGDGDGDPTGDGDGDPTGGGVCGDGTLDDGEACDDGNTADGDGCSATCTVSACGLTWSWSEDVDNLAAGGFDATTSIDGSVYVAGVTVDADNDAWVAKWNPDGSQAWSQAFDGGNGNDVAAALAFDASTGTIFATGWVDGSGDDRWVVALDGDGNEIWSEVYDHGLVMGGDDLGTGIAVTGDGAVVVASRVRVGDGDDDVLVSKLDASTGAELWSTTWSGMGDGMFSTDRSGPIAVADDGSVWVGAREHVDFNSQIATLLHFDADGNFVAAYQLQGGVDQQQDPIDVVTDGEDVYFAFEKSAFPYRGWLYKLGSDGSEQWVKTEADWVTIGADWAIRGLGVDGSGNLGVAGVFTNEEEGEGIFWGEAWTAKLDGAGEPICRGSHRVDDGNVIPPSHSIDGAGFGAGGFGLTGIETAGQGNATKLWTGYFLSE